jgi:hypothetical protein
MAACHSPPIPSAVSIPDPYLCPAKTRDFGLWRAPHPAPARGDSRRAQGVLRPCALGLNRWPWASLLIQGLGSGKWWKSRTRSRLGGSDDIALRRPSACQSSTGGASGDSESTAICAPALRAAAPGPAGPNGRSARRLRVRSESTANTAPRDLCPAIAMGLVAWAREEPSTGPAAQQNARLRRCQWRRRGPRQPEPPPAHTHAHCTWSDCGRRSHRL